MHCPKEVQILMSPVVQIHHFSQHHYSQIVLCLTRLGQIARFKDEI
jgi:hypothetical protein